MMIDRPSVQAKEKDDLDSLCISTGEKEVQRANIAEVNASLSSIKKVDQILTQGLSLDD